MHFIQSCCHYRETKGNSQSGRRASPTVSDAPGPRGSGDSALPAAAANPYGCNNIPLATVSLCVRVYVCVHLAPLWILSAGPCGWAGLRLGVEKGGGEMSPLLFLPVYCDCHSQAERYLSPHARFPFLSSTSWATKEFGVSAEKTVVLFRLTLLFCPPPRDGGLVQRKLKPSL